MHQHIEHLEHRSLRIAIGVTAAIFLAEVIGGFLSGSLALLSDAGHMLVDLFSLIVAYVGIVLSRKPLEQTPERFTYGYRRVEIIAAFLNTLTLLAICTYIGYEAFHRLLSDTPSIDLPLMLSVATLGLLGNGLSIWFLRHSESLNLRSAYLHVLTDLLSSVAVLLGGVVILFTQAYWIDPLLSLLVAALILRSALPIFKKTMGILLEAAPKEIEISEILREVQNIPGVQGIHDVHVWQLADRSTMITAHVVVHDQEDRDAVLQSVAKLLEEKFHIFHSTIQIESRQYWEEHHCHDCKLEMSVFSETVR